MKPSENRLDLTHDLFLPTLLFAALGGMTWAVRGCSGFGAVAGCIFAGVTWGAAWWFIAHDPCREQSRRYSSGWIVLALTFGVGLSGARGWMQWPHFFDQKLFTNAGENEFVPISRLHGFLWLFIAGVPWAGIGACALAWCGSLREMRIWHWVARIACGVGGGLLASYLYDNYPQYFLPLYDSLESQYKDLKTNPSLRRLIGDNNLAVLHMGYYLGFLAFEFLRRDWKNVVLIVTVGVVNGVGWALCQCWKWAPDVWPTGQFNWWRCWESSGGISIGIAYGIAYFLVNRRMSDREREIVRSQQPIAGPNFEWLLIFAGLAGYLGLFARPQMGGWGTWYWVPVIAFGGIYWLWNRPAVGIGDAALPAENAGTAGFRFSWDAVVGVVMLVGLFANDFVRMFATERRRGSRQLGLILLCVPLAFGIAWLLSNRKRFAAERAAGTPPGGDPNLERLGLALGLLAGLGLSLRNGLKGWFNIYLGDEDYWSRVLWQYLGPTFLVCLVALLVWILFRPIPRNFRGDIFRHASLPMWLVLIVQNAIAQLITGPLDHWTEAAFSIYYGLLFLTTAVIVAHYGFVKRVQASADTITDPIGVSVP